MKAILQINSLGVAQLRQKDGSTAIKTMRHGLSCLKDHYSRSPSMERKQEECKDVKDEPCSSDSKLGIIPIDCRTELVNDTNENLFPVYTRAFELQDIPTNESGHSRILVALLYNIALAHHLGSPQEGYETPVALESLQRAQTFYQFAMNVIRSDFTQDDVVDFKVVLMAIVNNLGYIHNHFRNFPEMRECLRLMNQLIRSPSICNEISYEDYEIFSRGAFAYIEELAVAPAA